MEVMIKPVGQINWDDPKIERAGIFPIFKDKDRSWIGFGISNYSAVISPLGGSFEKEDHDLLSTAVREYNEEVEQNYQNITEEDVLSCNAMINDCTIQIFLPVSPPKKEFRKTIEHYDMLWVTPQQLQIISRNQEYRFPKLNIKIFQVGGRCRNMLTIISSQLESGSAFETNGNLTTERPKKTYKIKKTKIVSSFDTFKEDATIPSNFLGHICVVVTSHTIGILTKNKIYYLIPNTEESFRMIGKLPSRAYISFEKDLHIWEFLKTIPNVQLITTAFRVKGHHLKVVFERDVLEARKNSDILLELDLLMEYEKNLYEIVEKTKAVFPEARALILSSVTFLNEYLNYYSEPTSQNKSKITAYNTLTELDRFLSNRSRNLRRINAKIIFYELEYLGFFEICRDGLVRVS